MTPATSLGYSAVAFNEDVLRVRLIPWQRWLLIHALELRPGGRFRFRTLLVMGARQNGKTTLVGGKNLWKMAVLGVPLVIGTAQNLDIAEEAWEAAVEIAESTPDLAAEIAHVDRTNGKKALRLANGSRWKIAAASRKGGRGLSGDDANLDELREHQTWAAWAAVSKTTMARPNAQIWAFSNAGDDRSIVLNELQAQARAAALDPGLGPSLGLFEWSAPDDVKCTCGRPESKHLADCRLQDRRAWAQANPSLGYTITEEAVASALATDPVPVFRTEVLCQRVPSLSGEWSVIPRAAWTPLADTASQPGRVVAFAADINPERSHGAIAVAGRRGDGLWHVEVTRSGDGVLDHRPGTAWMVPRLLELVGRWTVCAVVIDPASPAGSLIAPLEAAGVEVVKPSAREHAQACGALYDAVVPPEEGAPDWLPTLRHLGQHSLQAALAGAVRRPLADAWAWDRTAATAEDGQVVPVDISPLVAATLALHGHATRAHLFTDYDVLDSVF
ncbi:hypothetical protein [Spongiactinospora sp. TRM90649]|uniref:hypothetical protein n=1 Tax=Spongiactinospora sp. TRM90649 TaxID=3031114 RepID=UPI0023F78191|nr:hypothetical protein [Spongiactinospora sp. TRM90649]MDF5755811.1 hypothetical protein [Spongiactinospora sp. TRM90649]